MSTERIDVVVSETGDGSRIVKRNLDQIADSATRTGGVLRTLRDSMGRLTDATKQTTSPADELRRKMEAIQGPAARVTSELAAQVRQLKAVREAAQSARYQDLLKQQTALKAEIQAMNAPAKSLTESMWEARSAVLGWAAAFAVLGKGLQIADQYQVLENRLRATGLAGEELRQVQDKLLESANSTRSSLAGTVELYARLDRSSAELGVSQQQLIQFTQSLNQAILLSGATSQEAQAGLIQLSQGMASGTLRGDELRSVLEQLPEVADVIAKSLGVTRGELRQMGTDGKITAQVILKAFAEAREELAVRFAGLTPTMGQAFTVLNNKILEIVGKGGQGALGQVSRAILDFVDTIEDLGPAIAGIGFVVQAVVQVIRVSLLAFRAVSDAAALLVSSIGRAVFLGLTKILGFADDFVKEYGAGMPKAWQDSMHGMLGGARDWADGVQGYFAEVQDNSIEHLDKLGKAMADVYRIPEEMEKKTKKKPPAPPKGPDNTQLLSELAALAASYDKVWAAEQKVYDTTKMLDQAEAAGLVTEARSIQLQNLMIQSMQDQLDPMAAMNAKLKEQEANLKLTSQQIDANNQVRQIQQDLQSKGIVLSAQELGQLRSRVEFLQAETEAAGRRAEILQAVQPDKSLSLLISDLAMLQDQNLITQQQAQDYAAQQVASSILTYDQINQLRQADLISEQEASRRKREFWIAENQLRLNAASATFGNLTVLAQSTNSRLAAIGKASAVSQATIDGVLAVQKALASAPPPFNFALAASVGVATAANVAKIMNLPGFAFGGDFQVGGTGGTDSQLVAFRATPGERVQVSTPSQERQEGNSGTGSSASSVKVVNVLDPSLVGDYLETDLGEQLVLNVMRRNPRILRSLVS